MQQNKNKQKISRRIRGYRNTQTFPNTDSTNIQIQTNRESKTSDQSSNQFQHPLLSKKNLDPTIIYSIRKNKCDQSLAQFERPKIIISAIQSAKQPFHKNINQPDSNNNELKTGSSIEKIKNNLYFLKSTPCNFFRKNHRRNCMITTQKQFNDQCNKYIQQCQKQQAKQLFREIKRHMQLQIKNKEGNNFYQKIRKDAIKKINYMSYNHKYYQDNEVKHLNNIVDNCNMLIHKRQHPQGKHISRNINRKFSDNKKGRQKYDKIQFKRVNTEVTQRNKSSVCLQQYPQFLQLNGNELSKTMRNNKKRKGDKQNIKEKLQNIVHQCQQQQQKLKEVKSSIKVFKYFCDKLDTNFSTKETKLNNFFEDDSIC